MNRHAAGLLSLLVAFGLILPACAPAAATQAVPPGTLFQVVRADGSSQPFTAADLQNLPVAQITVDGKVEEGPRLLDVLIAAGVNDFSEVTLIGSSAPVTLTRDQVDDNTLLDLTNRGTLKLASTHVPKPDWTKDITIITVR